MEHSKNNSTKNLKKILCCKTIKNNRCVYQNKCMFAHSLDEQKKEPLRDKIHKYIDGIIPMNDVNIFDEREIFNELMIHTKLCKKCVFNSCAGGYNCKFGACNNNYLVCQHDLLFGNCINDNCTFGIHLTKNGLIPYSIGAIADTITSHYVINDNEDDKNYCVNYHYKINALSIPLNDETTKIISDLANASILD